jgi:MATE family multidrug resistance protein
VTRQGIWLATLLSIPVVAVTALIPTLLTMAGYDPNIVGMMSGMIYVGLCGIPALLWYTALRNFATVLHKTRIVVVISLISLAVAIFSNWLFLYGNWGAPRLGVTGVGVSWALASWVQLAIMAVYVQRERVLAAYRVLNDLLHPDGRILKDLFHVGWPISMSYAFETGLFLASLGLDVQVTELDLSLYVPGITYTSDQFYTAQTFTDELPAKALEGRQRCRVSRPGRHGRLL